MPLAKIHDAPGFVSARRARSPNPEAWAHMLSPEASVTPRA